MMMMISTRVVVSTTATIIIAIGGRNDPTTATQPFHRGWGGIVSGQTLGTIASNHVTIMTISMINSFTVTVDEMKMWIDLCWMMMTWWWWWWRQRVTSRAPGIVISVFVMLSSTFHNMMRLHCITTAVTVYIVVVMIRGIIACRITMMMMMML
jgi:hypothetical protein